MSINDSIRDWLNSEQGIEYSSFNDMWYNFFEREGILGALPDKWRKYAISSGSGVSKKDVIENILSRSFATLNGVNQYWQLSRGVEVMAGDQVSLSFIGGQISQAYARFFASSDNQMSIDSNADSSSFRLSGGVVTLDGSSISNGVLIPTSGHHTVSSIMSDDVTIETLGSLGTSRLINLALYNFKVIRSGEVIYSIPLSNRSQGATQNPTVGDVSASLVNYDASVWGGSNPPTNTSQPTVTGSTAPDDEVEVDDGEWESESSYTISYQWQLDGVDIIGATSSSLILLLAWLGSTVRCVVKCTNSFGFTISYSTSITVEL